MTDINVVMSEWQKKYNEIREDEQRRKDTLLKECEEQVTKLLGLAIKHDDFSNPYWIKASIPGTLVKQIIPENTSFNILGAWEHDACRAVEKVLWKLGFEGQISVKSEKSNFKVDVQLSDKQRGSTAPSDELFKLSDKIAAELRDYRDKLDKELNERTALAKSYLIDLLTISLKEFEIIERRTVRCLISLSDYDLILEKYGKNQVGRLSQNILDDVLSKISIFETVKVHEYYDDSKINVTLIAKPDFE